MTADGSATHHDNTSSTHHTDDNETFEVIYAHPSPADTTVITTMPHHHTNDTSSADGHISDSTIHTHTSQSTDSTPPTTPTPHFSINPSVLHTPHITDPVATLHADALTVSLQPMPTDSDVWCHTLSSPLKPLSINAYKRVKINPTKQCRLQLKVNKRAYEHTAAALYNTKYNGGGAYNKGGHRRRLAADGCSYETDSDSSSDDSDDSVAVQQSYTKRAMIQRHVYSNRVARQRAQRAFSAIDHDESLSSSSSSDSAHDSDSSDDESAISPVTTTDNTQHNNHDELSSNSETESVSTADEDGVDVESLIPSDLLDVAA